MNYLSPLIDGLVQGLQIKGMIQHQRLQNEAQMRAQGQQDRENQIQDMQTKIGLINSGAKPVAQDGTYQAQTPGAVPLGTALDQFMPGPQQMAVPADPSQTVTAPGGQSFRLPSLQEKLEAADAGDQRKARLKRQEDSISLPGIGNVDKAALPFYTGQQNIQAADKRAQAGQDFTAGQNQLNRDQQQTLADTAAANADKRLDKTENFQHNENALTRAQKAARDAKDDAKDGKAKPATAAQLDALETTKSAAMTKAETVYNMRVNQEQARAAKANRSNPSSAIDKNVIQRAEDERTQAKQQADSTYVESRKNYGVPVQPVDYRAQTAAAKATPAPSGKTPATPAAKTPATPAPSPAAAAPKLNEVRNHQGTDYKFDGTKWVAQAAK